MPCPQAVRRASHCGTVRTRKCQHGPPGAPYRRRLAVKISTTVDFFNASVRSCATHSPHHPNESQGHTPRRSGPKEWRAACIYHSRSKRAPGPNKSRAGNKVKQAKRTKPIRTKNNPKIGPIGAPQPPRTPPHFCVHSALFPQPVPFSASPASMR